MRVAAAGDAEGMPSSLYLDLPASVDVVARARRAIAECAEGIGVADIFAVGVAVSETVTNAVVHAYRDRDPGRVTLTAEHPPGDGLVVTVEDGGAGVRTRRPLPGLGLSLAAELADTFQLSTPPGGGTRVRMSFAA